MRELVLRCERQQAEAISDALLEAGALSVSVEDADLGTDSERPLFGEPGLEPDQLAWERNDVIALLPEDTEPEVLLTTAVALLEQAPGALSWHVREVSEQDWVRLTQSQFAPIPVGERLWIVPSWHRDDPVVSAQSDAIRIELDPGLAFGTGSHPTTHLCLQWLSECMNPGLSVLDYGCGSGILAIAAKLMGATTVHGVDIDSQAVESSRYNAEVNRVELAASLPGELAEHARYDVVVANILSNPLKVLAPLLCGRVADGGDLVLSGVLSRQAEEVAAVYAPWIALSVWRERDGWVCLHGRRA